MIMMIVRKKMRGEKQYSRTYTLSRMSSDAKVKYKPGRRDAEPGPMIQRRRQSLRDHARS